MRRARPRSSHRRRRLALRPQDPDRLEVYAPPDPGELQEEIESDITGLLYGLAGLALLVGMIGIANTTLVAVLERRAEIGVRRALGARRRHIAGQFLTESATLGTLGGILGTSLGILVVVFVSAQREWTTTLDPRLTIPAPIIGAVTGLLAGLQPSWRAARITPAVGAAQRVIDGLRLRCFSSRVAGRAASPWRSPA